MTPAEKHEHRPAVGHHRPTGSRWWRWALATLSTLLALAGAEVYVRSRGSDWALLERQLYFQQADLASHVADEDPVLLYRLRPSSVEHYPSPRGRYTVTVDEGGFRGPAHALQKPAGTFRIVCLGGSNVYGGGVSDDETWPAQLERALNDTLPCQRFQVWNLGVSAYTGVQMVRWAHQNLDALQPDLVLVALSNLGPRPFLSGADFRTWFRRSPELWDYLSDSERFSPLLRWPLSRSALTRLIVLELRTRQEGDRFGLWRLAAYRFERENVQAVRSLLAEDRPGRRFAVFLFPLIKDQPDWGTFQPPVEFTRLLMPLPGRGFPVQVFEPYTSGLDIPVFRLDAEQRPMEYTEAHPPPYVLTWYAENILHWLRSSQLIPTACSP